jgi:hypothetical protein
MLAFRGAVITAVVVLATACSGGIGDENTKARGEVVPGTASPDPSASQPTPFGDPTKLADEEGAASVT